MFYTIYEIDTWIENEKMWKIETVVRNLEIQGRQTKDLSQNGW